MDQPCDDRHSTFNPRPASVAWPILIAGLLVGIFHLVTDRAIEDYLQIESAWGQLGEIVLVATVTSAALWIGVLRPLQADAQRQRAAAETRQRALEEHNSAQAFNGQLHRALEMATTEDRAYDIIKRALEVIPETRAAELLLADSSDSHLKRATALTAGDADGCGVIEPRDCAAIRRAQTLRFESSSALDACRYLDNRASGPCSGVCVPMSVAGRSIGVLHAIGRDGAPPYGLAMEKLEAIAAQGGSKIGLLRVMDSATLRASTDPLTGMLNRRSFEDSIRSLLLRRPITAIAMADLDHFKRLNDTYGHAAGDRALRLFAQLVHSSLRREDLACRYGGEEFVLAFPGLDASTAALALERIRENLVVALADGTVPPFTASFGVVDTTMIDDFEGLCRAADISLYDAKNRGRNRVVIYSASSSGYGPHLADIQTQAPSTQL